MSCSPAGSPTVRCGSPTTSARPWTLSDVVFVCVGTPPGPDGKADTTAIRGVAVSIAKNLRHHHTIVTKSTVPIGTGFWLGALIEDIVGPDARELFGIVSNPEFLREGSAVQDFLHPDRVVLGSDDQRALNTAVNVYKPILEQRIPGDVGKRDVVPLLQTKLTTAEMIKYASNAFLATKISFANEIARLCDFVGADVTEVTAGMGLDTRIGGRFLDAGLGWGGSCFGKDLSALISTAGEYGYRPRLLESAVSVNESQRKYVVDLLLRDLRTLRGAKICILGLSFKPHTDDLRDSPAVDVASRLIGRGAFVAAYDPMVTVVPEVPDIRHDAQRAEGGRGRRRHCAGDRVAPVPQPAADTSSGRPCGATSSSTAATTSIRCSSSRPVSATSASAAVAPPLPRAVVSHRAVPRVSQAQVAAR